VEDILNIVKNSYDTPGALPQNSSEVDEEYGEGNMFAMGEKNSPKNPFD